MWLCFSVEGNLLFASWKPQFRWCYLNVYLKSLTIPLAIGRYAFPNWFQSYTFINNLIGSNWYWVTFADFNLTTYVEIEWYNHITLIRKDIVDMFKNHKLFLYMKLCWSDRKIDKNIRGIDRINERTLMNHCTINLSHKNVIPSDDPSAYRVSIN